MFIDSRELPDGSVIEGEICIVGGGAAGITMALELAGSGLDVIILESGGHELDGGTQGLYAGENTGFPYYDLMSLRLRFFGGTTNHWAGACQPLQPLDFETRSWVPNSGWPIDYDTLTRWYERAQEICELGDYDYSTNGWEDAGIPAVPLPRDRVQTAMFQHSPPTRFGSRYRDALSAAENIRIYLWANVTDVSTHPDGRYIEQIDVRTLTGKSFQARANRFVLAMGALENVRLLLASRQGDRFGVGNGSDCVGRYFMEHLSAPAALLVPNDPAFDHRLYTQHTVRPSDNIPGKGFFVVPPDVQEREGMVNARAFLDNQGRRTIMQEQSAIGEAAIDDLRADIREGAPLDEVGEGVVNLFATMDEVTLYTYRRFVRPLGAVNAYTMVCHLEQAPNPTSRVTLGEERDPLGLPRLQLNWQFGELERHTFTRLCELIGEACGAAGFGRVRLLEADPATGYPPDTRGAWHQMGTTRMSADPQSGVVDTNCRLHDVENLYIAGSGVFPTSGYTNPTLTIVAMSARLADHLRNLP